MTSNDDSLIEVFLTNEPVIMQVAVGVLEDMAIATSIVDMAKGPYPMSVGPMGEAHLLVGSNDQEEARRLLKEALANGALLSGEVVNPD
jgi:hypothetical protein